LSTTTSCTALINDLAQQGWAINQQLLTKSTIENLRQEILQAYDNNELSKAKLGQAALTLETIRGDLIQWVDPSQEKSPALSEYCDFLEEFQSHLNRELQLGLKDFELHYTVYPVNRYYQRHVDQFAHKKTRRVSFVLYLNQQWHRNDGGLLTLFDKSDLQAITTILPEGNLFICFLSDIPHEISETHRERLSVTGWFKSY
jgi:SM-20-related protein